MSWPIYSVRFMNAAGAGVETTFTVPVGKRAVVRHLVARNDGGTGARIWLKVGALYVYLHDFPATVSSITVPMMVVAYGGEKIVLYTVTDRVAGSLSGFLFDDLTGASADDAELEREVRPIADVLPER